MQVYIYSVKATAQALEGLLIEVLRKIYARFELYRL